MVWISVGDIRGDGLTLQTCKSDVDALSFRSELVLEHGNRVQLGDGIGRAIARHHQQACRFAPRRKSGERADRGVITPMQILEQQHQGSVGGELFDERQQLANHALTARPGEQETQCILLARLQQAWQLQ